MPIYPRHNHSPSCKAGSSAACTLPSSLLIVTLWVVSRGSDISIIACYFYFFKIFENQSIEFPSCSRGGWSGRFLGHFIQ